MGSLVQSYGFNTVEGHTYDRAQEFVSSDRKLVNSIGQGILG